MPISIFRMIYCEDYVKQIFFSYRFGFAGGENESSIKKTTEEDMEIIRRRETKWLHMLDHWDKYMLEKYKKVRHRCRKGSVTSVLVLEGAELIFFTFLATVYCSIMQYNAV